MRPTPASTHSSDGRSDDDDDEEEEQAAENERPSADHRSIPISSDIGQYLVRPHTAPTPRHSQRVNKHVRVDMIDGGNRRDHRYRQPQYRRYPNSHQATHDNNQQQPQSSSCLQWLGLIEFSVAAVMAICVFTLLLIYPHAINESPAAFWALILSIAWHLGLTAFRLDNPQSLFFHIANIMFDILMLVFLSLSRLWDTGTDADAKAIQQNSAMDQFSALGETAWEFMYSYIQPNATDAGNATATAAAARSSYLSLGLKPYEAVIVLFLLAVAIYMVSRVAQAFILALHWVPYIVITYMTAQVLSVLFPKTELERACLYIWGFIGHCLHDTGIPAHLTNLLTFLRSFQSST